MQSESPCNSSPVGKRGPTRRPRKWRPSKISRLGTAAGRELLLLTVFPLLRARRTALASCLTLPLFCPARPARSSLNLRLTISPSGMFSALSLSQQLRTLSAVKAPCFSSFAALRSEPPGSARRASGSSIDDLFDRYAPKLEPMTTPGTSPSQVRSHPPPIASSVSRDTAG